MKAQSIFRCAIVFLFGLCATNAFAQGPPIIIDFSPKIANPQGNNVITIRGRNFNRDTTTNNFVLFGQMRSRGNGNPDFVTDTMMRVRISFGASYGPITITDTVRHLTAYSRHFMKPTANNPTRAFVQKKRKGPGRFSIAGDFYPAAMLDIVSSVVDTFRQDFMAVMKHPIFVDSLRFIRSARVSDQARGPAYIARGQLNGDAYMEVAMATADPGKQRMAIFHNNGSADFDAVMELPLPGTPSDIAIQDLDLDGRPDIAVTISDSNLVMILRNITSPSVNWPLSFAAPVLLRTQGEPYGIALGDVTGDSLVEIVVTERNLNQVAIYKNNGGLNFVPQRFSFGSRPEKIRLVDIDGDDNLDIVVTHPDDGFLTARLERPTFPGITLSSEYPIQAGGPGISNLDVGDIDVDGMVDIAVVNRLRNSVSYMLNRTLNGGPVSFTAPVSYAAGRGPLSVAFADFGPDASQDLLVSGNPVEGSCGDSACYRFSDVFVLQAVTNSVPVFSANATSLPYVGVPIGSVRTDTVTVLNNIDLSLKASLEVTALVSGQRFRVSPNGIQSVGGGGGNMRFLVTFSPVDTLLQRDTLTFVHNASGSPYRIPLSGKGVNNVAPPNPTAPADNATNVSAAQVQLQWSRVAAAIGYHLQVATDSAFASLAIDTATPDTTITFVNSLAYNAKYYWHVASRVGTGDGAYSQPPHTFSTVVAASVSGSISFPPNPTKDTDYRLVSIPGISRLKVSDILSGAQKTDWRIFRENGANPPDDLTELSAGEELKTGEGYLMLKKGTFSFSRSVLMPPVGTNSMYSFPVEKRWLLIGNPFEKAITWQSVRAANGPPSLPESLYTYVGSSVGAGVLEPFKGYLFDNSSGVDSLRFPYPFPNRQTVTPTTPEFVWKLQLMFESENTADRANYIGISRAASAGRDTLEGHKPPLFLDKGTISFFRPQWDAEYSFFNSDFRPALGDGQVWEFDVRNDRLTKAKIRIVGIEQIPKENDVVLVNLQSSVPVNIREKPEYEYQTVSSKMKFKLIVGKKEFIANTIQKDLPTEFRLEQNYPNPFNPSTSLSFSLPRGADVKLEIVSVLGQRVALLGEGRYQPGRYTIVWNPTGAEPGNASGVYFCRFIVDGKPNALRKMLLLK